MNEGLDNGNLLEKTVKEIKAIEGEVAVMGVNDYEIPALEALINSVKNKEISPEEAVRQAIKIRDTKQDYH
jgi:hypothetical protein